MKNITHIHYEQPNYGGCLTLMYIMMMFLRKNLLNPQTGKTRFEQIH
jgi:hypothetical protein